MMEQFDSFVTDRAVPLADVQRYMQDPERNRYFLGRNVINATAGSGGRPAVVLWSRDEWAAAMASAFACSPIPFNLLYKREVAHRREALQAPDVVSRQYTYHEEQVRHTVPLVDDRPARSLRERKKAKTRAAIQQHALRLFRAQGYAATTVEQIAEAAEVSPSTFFRYFPTKEDVVLYDELDPLLVAAFESQPDELSPIQAMRGALRSVFAGLSAAELEDVQERARLSVAVPELRMRMLDQLAGAIRVSAQMLAKRLHRRADDLAMHTLAGAIIGSLMAALLAGIEDPAADFFALMDASLAYLESGLPL
jgi:AcrR family transcriptional regulator